jgi:hypothetical protein
MTSQKPRTHRHHTYLSPGRAEPLGSETFPVLHSLLRPTVMHNDTVEPQHRYEEARTSRCFDDKKAS